MPGAPDESIHIKGKVEELKRALFMREVHRAAELYRDVLVAQPDFTLREPVQFDLAVLLERAGHDHLAFEAYRLLLERQPGHKARMPALKSAGKLAWKLKKPERAYQWLSEFLRMEPSTDSERDEAKDILRQIPLRAKPKGASPEADSAVELDNLRAEEEREEEKKRASSQSRVSMEWKIPKGHRRPSEPPVENRPREPEKAPAVALPDPPALVEPSPPPPMDPEPAAPKAAAEEALPNRAGAPRAETPEDRYDRLSKSRFSLLLPQGKKIHLAAVASLVARIEKISDVEARKRIIKRKGLLFDDLTMAEVMDLYPLVKQCRQALLFVSAPPRLRIAAVHEVLSASLHDRGLKMNTEQDLLRMRWEDILLVNCGTIAGEVTVTVVGGRPVQECCFVEQVFDIEDFLPSGERNFRNGLREFLELLAGRATRAARSQTVEALIKGRAAVPQTFSNMDEYHWYTRWLLCSHLAEVVDPEELAEVSRVTSNW